MSIQHDRSSPRTASEPMAFTDEELLRGACSAWVIFMALLLIGTTASITPGIVAEGWSPSLLTGIGFVLLLDLYVLVIGGILSAIVMALGLVIAKPLGLLLRRVRPLWAHLLAYTALGFAIAIGYVAIIRSLGMLSASSTLDLLFLIPAFAVVIAVPLGWWRTAHLSLREDRGLGAHRRPRKPDADTVAEDHAEN